MKPSRSSSGLHFIALAIALLLVGYFVTQILGPNSDPSFLFKSQAALIHRDMSDHPLIGDLSVMTPSEIEEQNRLLATYYSAYAAQYPAPKLPVSGLSSRLGSAGKTTSKEYAGWVEEYITAHPKEGFATIPQYESYYRDYYQNIALHNPYAYVVGSTWCRGNTIYPGLVQNMYFFSQDGKCPGGTPIITIGTKNSEQPTTSIPVTQPTPPSSDVTVPPATSGQVRGGSGGFICALTKFLGSQTGSCLGEETAVQTWVNKNLPADGTVKPDLCKTFPFLTQCQGTKVSEDSALKKFLAAVGNVPKSWIERLVALFKGRSNDSTDNYANENGARVESASLAILNLLHRGKNPLDQFGDQTVQDALKAGSIKITEDEVVYLPYQDPKYPTIYYYRCGPYDLVGTEARIKIDCNRQSAAGGLKRYSFDPAGLMKLDIQSGDRSKFVDGVPPFVFRYRKYVYGGNDPTMTFLVEKIPTSTDITEVSCPYGGMLRPGSIVGSSGCASRYLGMTALLTYKADERADINWLRFDHHDAHKVYDVTIDKNFFANPPTIYARYGDTIRFIVHHEFKLPDSDRDAYIYIQSFPIDPLRPNGILELAEANKYKFESIAAVILTRKLNPYPIVVMPDGRWVEAEYYVHEFTQNSPYWHRIVVKAVSETAENISLNQDDTHALLMPEDYSPRGSCATRFSVVTGLDPKFLCFPRKDKGESKYLGDV